MIVHIYQGVTHIILNKKLILTQTQLNNIIKDYINIFGKIEIGELCTYLVLQKDFRINRHTNIDNDYELFIRTNGGVDIYETNTGNKSTINMNPPKEKIISFKYNGKSRVVSVKEETDKYVSGLDILDKHKYKKFSRCNMFFVNTIQ